MQMDEYVPHVTPTRSGRANSRIEDTPKIRSDATMTAVVKLVESDLVSVSVIDLSARFLNPSSVFRD